MGEPTTRAGRGAEAWTDDHDGGWRAGHARTGGGGASWRPDVRRLVGPLVLLLIAGAAVALLISGLPGFGQGPPASSPTTTPPSVAEPSGSPAAAPSPASRTPAPGPSASAGATARPTAGPTGSADPGQPATPVPSRPPGAAPASADEFDTEGDVVVDIEFPFKPGVRYRYRDNWLHRRPGPPEDYNHARGPRRGRIVRAHDGIDLYAPLNTPVVAPFAGLVIDPAERWQPWHPERHGGAVTIVSQEPLSAGYVAILSHLEEAFVEPGDVVRRGEVIGLAGNTGNAEGGRVHLHFELRAPFLLEWSEAGERRMVDAFNPYPSLRAADPRAPD